MSEQPALPGIPMADATLIDQTHTAERLLFEEALRDVPFGDLYADMVAQGWYWRKAAVVAWLSTPKSKRMPDTQRELANMLGCNEGIITQIKQRPEVQAQMMRLTMAGLLSHKASVDEALVQSASSNDYKSNQDRKTYYQLIGALREQHDLNVRADDSAMSDMSTDELMALAALADDDEAGDD